MLVERKAPQPYTADRPENSTTSVDANKARSRNLAKLRGTDGSNPSLARLLASAKLPIFFKGDDRGFLSRFLPQTGTCVPSAFLAFTLVKYLLRVSDSGKPEPLARNSQDLWIGVSRDLLITTL